MAVGETLLDDAVGNIGYPVDVIVMRTERFERTKRAASRRKYLKALLTRYQIEFPKTHDIKTLPRLAGSASGPVAETVTGASRDSLSRRNRWDAARRGTKAIEIASSYSRSCLRSWTQVDICA